MRQPLRILGIDPGTATTGYGIVETDGETLVPIVHGVITTSPALPLSCRLKQLHTQLLDLIRVYGPTQAAVEELFFSRNARTAMAVGHARGVVLLGLADARLPISEYTPTQVKQATTGYGGATKEQVQEMVRLLLGLDYSPHPDDAADALAVAICHAHAYPLAARLASQIPEERA